MPSRPVRLGVILPRGDVSPLEVRGLLEVASLADDLWVDEVIALAGRGPDPLAVLAATARVTTSIGLVAGIDVSGLPDGDQVAAGVATVHAIGRGRAALLVEHCARAPDQAAAVIGASRARVAGHLEAHLSGPATAEVMQLAATVADGWQFPAAAPLGEVMAAASAVGDRRQGTGRRRRLEVRTVLAPRAPATGEGMEEDDAGPALWDLHQVAAHMAAGASVVVADLDEARVRGIDPRVALTELAEAFADLHLAAQGQGGEPGR